MVFRGYLLTAALLLERRVFKTERNWPSVGVAVIFMLCHSARADSTWIQLCCILLTGTLYGFTRLRLQSTVAAVLAHGCYNLALYLSCWTGFSN